MLLSMTGYGRVSRAFGDKTITIEMRALNSKHTDVRMKIPQHYKEKEADIRKLILDRVERGKVDLVIEVDSAQGDDSYGLNQALFRKYHRELSKLREELNINGADMIQAILRLPNVVATASESLDEEEWKALSNALKDALQKLHQYRHTEGAALEKDMILRVNNIAEYVDQLSEYEEDRVVRLRQRLHQSLEEHLGKENIDENRFEQEILFYLEKIDLTEEKVRLTQHCKYYLEELEKDKAQKGRKLNFISQEMGREINTMGAKAYSSDIQRLVVSMKDELEKIKEQVANSV